MAAKKRRVRSHVIADLSVNHVEYHVLKAGFVMETVRADYGYDGSISTFDKQGRIENGPIYVQLKATSIMHRHERKDSVALPVSRKDLNLWLGEPFPVFVVFFDAVAEKAYWLHLQNYLLARKIRLSSVKGSLTLRFKKASIMDKNTPELWRAEKHETLKQIRAVFKRA